MQTWQLQQAELFQLGKYISSSKHNLILFWHFIWYFRGVILFISTSAGDWKNLIFSHLASGICHYGCTGAVMWDHMYVISFVQYCISSHYVIDDPPLPCPPSVVLVCPRLSLYPPAALLLLPVVIFILVPDVLATVAPAALPVCLCSPQLYFPIPHLS